MSRETNIEWCDSSLNLMMGCDGCELWNPAKGIKHCYAGVLTERYAGVNAGFPKSFDQPKIFRERIYDIAKWHDLTGKDRADKPWLNGMPRLIFLNDMGDTFTESLDLNWLAEKWGPMVCPKGHKPPLVQFLKQDRAAGITEDAITCTHRNCLKQWKPQSCLDMMHRSAHHYLLLTKRPQIMAAFSLQHEMKRNIWPGTTITSQANMSRLRHLLKVTGGGPKWLSIEPLLGPLKFDPQELKGINWVIVGGESGKNARQMDEKWVQSILDECRKHSIPFFMKQWDKIVEVPDHLMIREMPYAG